MTLARTNATTMDDLVVDDLVMVDMDNDVAFDDMVEDAATGDLKGLNELTRTTVIPYVVVLIFLLGVIAFFATRKFLKLEKKHSKLEIDMGVKAGYYPDLTNKNSYCICTGSAALTSHTKCAAGLKWDGFPNNRGKYLKGKDPSGVKFGKRGLYGTVGGTCTWDWAVSNKTKKRPPYK